MNFKDLLKKYWFVGIIALALVVFIGAYAVDAYKNREITVPSKVIDGKYAAYSVNDEYGFADDLYNTLYNSNGISMSFSAYLRAILDKAYETTTDMENLASQYAQYAIYQNGQEQMEYALYASGYVNGTDDLIQYYIDAQKQELLTKDYFLDHMDDITAPYIKENEPRIIYHILVKVADVEEVTDADGIVTHIPHPTEDEQAKIDTVLEALKTQKFEEVAAAHSDDGSAQQGGYLTVVDKTNASNYVQEFADACFTLGSGEVSDLVATQYGYHIIWNMSNETEDLLNDSNFLSLLQTANPNASIQAVIDKGNALGFEIVDEKLNTEIKKALGGEE